VAATSVGSPVAPGQCLNCEAKLRGRFCSACGQRAIAPYPTIREMVGDAWEELSGYDGRFARTLRLLFGRPGALTVETLEGRRARYITPVRLYLLASLVYFLCAATIPNIRIARPAAIPGSGVNITVDGSGAVPRLTPEERERALRDIDRAPWWIQAFLRPVVADPMAFRTRFLRTLPRVLFGLVPVFAGIVALFYRGRGFVQHLVFAVHLHAAIFITLAIRELSQLTRSLVVLQVCEVAAALVIVVYSLLAFRRVYAERWPRVLAKGAGIAAVYGVAGIAALLATMAWAGLAG
jgi:hypothetical protein